MSPPRTGLRVAGIDVGTSYLKAVCVDLDPASERPAALVALRREPTPSGAEDLVAAAVGLLREVTEEAGPVAAVGVASMAETGVPLDEHGRPLTPLLTWDARRLPSAALGDLDPQTLFARTGVRLSPKVPLATWAWLADSRPDVRTRMRHWAGAADLVALALTGRIVTDHTLAGRTGVYLLDRDGWAEDLLGLVGVSPAVLPEVVGPDEVAGRAGGVPVVVAGHDHQVGAHACGVRSPGDTADSLGTTEVLLRVLDGEPDREGVRRAGMSLVRTVGGRELALVAGNSAAGSAYAAWVADHPESDDLPAGPTGLLVLPYLRGRQCPDPDPGATMRVVGDVGPAGPGALTKAVLEGLCLQARWMYDEQRRLDPGAADGPVVLLGGPGARNAAWTRVKSEVLPRPLRVVAQEEPVAVGAAVVAAERAGLVPPGSVVLSAAPVTRPPRDPFAQIYREFVRAARERHG
ncbi:FGGY-family carbohydrate kinase [Nocardioides sp. T2.26MG-1]|uniref:FGGY-family carbohydrate kinase n=1 Tax=Nocardioides sp. T2.26MG-1 TaxID=3041166 RepID=UPI002477798D|nr:FGGY family carbohydrate kinase [Nocardioides sp. T2.26MG-1]CAI9399043.1 Apulose kinase [Nocardioides sp. T2.26MG-1]